MVAKRISRTSGNDRPCRVTLRRLKSPLNDVAIGSEHAADVPGRRTVERRSIGKNPMPLDLDLDRLIRRTIQPWTPSVGNCETVTVKSCVAEDLTFRADHHPCRRDAKRSWSTYPDVGAAGTTSQLPSAARHYRSPQCSAHYRNQRCR